MAIGKKKTVACNEEIKHQCKYGARFDESTWYCNYIGMNNGVSRPCPGSACTCFKQQEGKRDYCWMNINKVDTYIDYGSIYRIGK